MDRLGRRLIDLNEAAPILAISTRRLKRLYCAGRFTYYHIGHSAYFLRDDLEDFLDSVEHPRAS